MRRVVVTGMGLVTPLGIGTEATWAALMENRSAVGPIRRFDASSLRTRVAAELADFDPEAFVDNRRMLRLMTRDDQLAFAAAKLALADAKLEGSGHDGDLIALYVGGDKQIADPTQLLEAAADARDGEGTVDIHRFARIAPSVVHPLFYVQGLHAASLFFISQAFGFTGPSTYFAGGAESSAVAVGTACRVVRRGDAEVALAGGFDDTASWWNLSQIDGLEVMTDRNELGAAACRPYDRDRTGSVVGEGAAFLVLEEYHAATRRGARIYAEVTGFGSGFDAYRLVVPHPEGRGLARALRAALREADTKPDAIDYIVSHGSATRLGDTSEARAIRAIWGPACQRLAGSSIKAATGHLGAAAGALNVAVAALAIHHQAVPPTLNLDNLDPDCELDWVPRQARNLAIREAVAVARGFEGQATALVLRAAAS